MPVANSWFWNERFWLPINVTWADLRNSDEARYPQAEDLYSAFPYAILIFLIRIVFERFVATPVALCIGVKAGRVNKAESNTILEKVFKTVTQYPSKKHVQGLAKQLDWSTRQVERWFRHRRNQERPTLLTKFCESSWRFTFYTAAFIYGFQHMKELKWFWDTKYCWIDYPYQSLTDQLEKYYLLELSFYCSLLFSQFLDVKRKDFVQMFIHHIATVMLIGFSWVVNMIRVGALIILTHDVSDIFLEAAKMTNYAKYQRICDVLFIIFAIIFFVSRLIVFPLYVFKSAAIESREICGPWPSWWIFNILLLVLQLLHIFWFSIIMRMVYKSLTHGKVDRDARSDCEESSTDEYNEDEDAKGTFINNGKIGQMNSTYKH
ncbi:ceramide synthase 6-like [Saccoglossus kowalevskii]|uniref:Ceramide synthase 6-like n=1 Tax=Saccoglossus kowalevskii TaxID=10224 RepID=A0ABM0GLN3_SACKO|nr:PREDICTED: ceramide synthase 6-like [Saccoglossus kowalevskii]